MMATSLVLHAIQLGHRNIPNQDLGMVQWFSMDVLWDVANCKVHWVCHLVSEKSKLHLV